MDFCKYGASRILSWHSWPNSHMKWIGMRLPKFIFRKICKEETNPVRRG